MVPEWEARKECCFGTELMCSISPRDRVRKGGDGKVVRFLLPSVYVNLVERISSTLAWKSLSDHESWLHMLGCGSSQQVMENYALHSAWKREVRYLCFERITKLDVFL